MNKAIGLWGVLDFGLAGVSFSQEFSPLGFNWAGADAVGLGQLFAKGLGTMASTAPLLDPVLQLFAKADSGWEPVGLTSRRCHPAGIVEEGLAGAARVRQSVHFASDRTVVVRYEPVDGDELPPLAVAGVLRPGIARLSGRGLDDGMLLTLDLRVQSTFTDRTADVKLRLRVHCQGASAAGFVPQAFSALGVADAGREDRLHEASEAGYWLELPRRDAVEFHLSWDTRTDDVRPKVQIPTLAAAVSDFEALIARLPATEPAGPYWRRKLAQAVAGLVGSSVRSEGWGTFSDTLATLCTVSGWSSTDFYWDHMTSMQTMGTIDPALAESGLQNYLRHNTHDRMTPGILLAFPEHTERDTFKDCYAPIQTYAMLKLEACTGRAINYASVYEGLCRHQKVWHLHMDRDGDGIPEWKNTGNPADDSPRFDRYALPGGRVHCIDVPPFWSADIAAYLMLDQRCLAAVARKLGREDDAKHWEGRARFYRDQLMENHWDEKQKLFFDRAPPDERGQRDWTRAKTFFCFLPFWAGLGLGDDGMPEREARASIERHLLNPAEFFGEIPFPSVAYDEPTYDPTGYWRGRCWPHIYMWMTELLWLWGYEKEAERAKRVFLSLNAKWGIPAENWPSRPDVSHKRGVPNYNWGSATVCHFLWNWHRKPLRFGPLAGAPISK